MMHTTGWRGQKCVSYCVQQFGVKSCRLVLLVEFDLAVIVIRVVSASVVGSVPSLTRSNFFFFDTQHFLHKEAEYFITGLDRIRDHKLISSGWMLKSQGQEHLIPSEHALTLALTSHCRNLHFCLILFGPPNFFMSLQKSHWAQSSVLLQGSHSPHILTDLFTWEPSNNDFSLLLSIIHYTNNTLKKDFHITFDPRRLSLLYSGVLGVLYCLSALSGSTSFSRDFFDLYFISREGYLSNGGQKKITMSVFKDGHIYIYIYIHK